MPADASSGPAFICRVCTLVAELRCSGCKQVAYCSKEHQKEDWKRHKNNCRAYEVLSSEELGRFLVAARDLKPGDVVMVEAPLAFAPKATPDPENCAPCVGCYRPVSLDVGERCANCGWPICSGLCEGLQDIRHHGLECPVLSLRGGCAVSHMGDYYRHDTLLPLRILLSQVKFQKKYNKIMELQSHLEDRGPETEIHQEVEEFTVKYLQDNFLHALHAVEAELKTNIAPDISTKLLHKICGIIDVNSLDLRLNSGSVLAALYSNACLMEHSCSPNTKHSFDLSSRDEGFQFRIIIKAVIPIQKGEHITTMYSHALWGTQARREHLKETKYFSCVCERCKDPTELGTNLSAMKCLGAGKPCGGIQLPGDPYNSATEWACDKCDVKVMNNEISYLVSKMGEEVDNVQASSPTVSQLEELITKLETFLHPNHYHLYSVKHSLVQLYGYQQGYLYHQLSDELLDKKVSICNELIDVTVKLDPGNSRLSLYTGVLYHELFQAKFQIAKRKLDKKGVSRNEVGELTREMKEHLKKAQFVLEEEAEGSAGKKLIDIMKESERNLLRWIKDNLVM